MKPRKAWQLWQFGLEHLTLHELPDLPLGNHQVRLAIKAVSLNYRDYLVIEGSYNPRQTLPLIPGSDASAEVIEVGAEVNRFQVGDRVCPIFCQEWLQGPPSRQSMRTSLGSPLQGTLQSQCVLHQDGLVAIPDYLDWEEASTLPCAAVTAWNALQGLPAGSKVLLLGTGGVSLFALQLARALGFRVALLSSQTKKLDLARSLGAEFTLNYRQTPDWSRQVRDWSGDGLDGVVEVGGATLEQSLRCLKPGGQISLVGMLAGRETQLNVVPILMQQLRIQGILVGHRGDFEALNRFLTKHQLRPRIDSRFPFEQAPQALKLLESGAHVGKIVVVGPE